MQIAKKGGTAEARLSSFSRDEGLFVYDEGSIRRGTRSRRLPFSGSARHGCRDASARLRPLNRFWRTVAAEVPSLLDETGATEHSNCNYLISRSKPLFERSSCNHPSNEVRFTDFRVHWAKIAGFLQLLG